MNQTAIELQDRFKNDRFEIISRGKASESGGTVYGELFDSLAQRLATLVHCADNVRQNGGYVVSIVQEK